MHPLAILAIVFGSKMWIDPKIEDRELRAEAAQCYQDGLRAWSYWSEYTGVDVIVDGIEMSAVACDSCNDLVFSAGWDEVEVTPGFCATLADLLFECDCNGPEFDQSIIGYADREEVYEDFGCDSDLYDYGECEAPSDWTGDDSAPRELPVDRMPQGWGKIGR